jgi:hypothetical protein
MHSSFATLRSRNDSTWDPRRSPSRNVFAQGFNLRGTLRIGISYQELLHGVELAGCCLSLIPFFIQKD